MKVSGKIWFLVGACISYLVPITSGVFGFAAWMAPFFLLMYVYREQSKITFSIAVLFLSAVSIIANIKVVPGGLAVVSITVISSIILLMLLLLLNKWVVHRTGHPIAVFFFPVMMTAIEYVFSYGNVFGTFNSAAYSQLPFRPLAMWASITGIWGIIFIQYLIVSLLAYTFRVGFRKGFRLNRPLWISVLAIMLVVVSVGGVLDLGHTHANTVKVAGITPDRELWDDTVKQLIESWETSGFYEKLTDSPLLLEQIRYVNSGLFNRSEEEFEKGSNIISWSEGAAFVLEKEEKAFIERLQTLAQTHEGVIIAGFMKVNTGDKTKMDNQLIIVDTDGKIVADYTKFSLVGGEEKYFHKGQNPVPVVNTAYGKIAAAICFDADFPHRIREAGLEDPDILILPSSDWEAITPYHTKISAFRAIENRTAVMRVVHAGMSSVYDEKGRTVAEMNDFDAKHGTVITAELPLPQEKYTIYKSMGDMLPLISGMMTLVFLIYGGVKNFIIRRKSHK